MNKKPIDAIPEAAAVEPQADAPRYSKRAILDCPRFASRRDALNILLREDKTYSFQEAEKLLNDYMKEKVK